MSDHGEGRTKRCAGCGEEKPLAEFRRHNRSADGRGQYCRLCRLKAAFRREMRRNLDGMPPFEQWARNPKAFRRIGGLRGPMVNMASRTIERLLFRHVIDLPQASAGIRYRKHWELAGLAPVVTASYGERLGVGETTYGMPLTESQARHREHLRRANEALGVFYQRVAERVCVEDCTLEQLARGLGYRGGRKALCAAGRRRVIEALDILVDHWGLRGRERPARAASWKADGTEMGVHPEEWEE